ncbi:MULTISPECIES: response regulator [Reichenbachiella]|uniref:Response regulator receiver domain-containing protein n=1 Tax=Reichenbachiella agariperforans TaxID=156994 RepID=A0A1M6J8R0_REIAG|nr:MULTISPECIES: response regulator [Reichenbachiella]MBU2913102.1 response regulator [Reichenbachiella agariperforans]RJE74896.1 hypothetical protein BGP76_17380 [Reichenbachiella sp. MSK19-1]SHJ43020.1 Response regulator receiver domain-containing protein [Reichenbachiella agariperforans]
MREYRCKNALLIDNNATDNYAHKLAIIESQLAENVAVVTSGKAAIDYLKSSGCTLPKLILFDVHIPVIEGQVFLHEYAMLNHFDKEDVKIVVLTYEDQIARLEKLLINEEIHSIARKPLSLEDCERLGDLVV